MGTGGWTTRAGEAAPSTTGVPLWLAIVLAVGAVLNPILASWLTYRAARSGQSIQRHQSYRDLILKAAELVRSPERDSREQGFAMLEGIAQMQGLSADDAKLIQVLTRQVLERRLEEARAAQQREGRRPSFWKRQITLRRDEEGR